MTWSWLSSKEMSEGHHQTLHVGRTVQELPTCEFDQFHPPKTAHFKGRLVETSLYKDFFTGMSDVLKGTRPKVQSLKTKKLPPNAEVRKLPASHSVRQDRPDRPSNLPRSKRGIPCVGSRENEITLPENQGAKSVVSPQSKARVGPRENIKPEHVEAWSLLLEDFQSRRGLPVEKRRDHNVSLHSHRGTSGSSRGRSCRGRQGGHAKNVTRDRPGAGRVSCCPQNCTKPPKDRTPSHGEVPNWYMAEKDPDQVMIPSQHHPLIDRRGGGVQRGDSSSRA